MNPVDHKSPLARLTSLCLLASLVLVGCKSTPSGPTGRVMDVSEGDLTGDTKAGASLYKPQVESLVQSMLASRLASESGLERARLCVLRIENDGMEELGDWGEQLFSLIRTSIDTSNQFNNLSTRVMDRALQEGNMVQDDLLLPKYQRKFSEILEASGQPIQYLVYPRLSTGTTTSGGQTQREYHMELELVALASGESISFTSKPMRKAYTR